MILKIQRSMVVFEISIEKIYEKNITKGAFGKSIVWHMRSDMFYVLYTQKNLLHDIKIAAILLL